MRVLIVEDLATDAELAEREVQRAVGEAEFLVVETREQFLAALETFRPDVILSDYELPRFDGIEAMKLALAVARDTPFIIVTGARNEDTAVECMKAGAWDYVIKERIKRLGPAVQAALATRQARTARQQAERELQYRNLLLATQQEASTDGILVIDEHGRIASCNRRFLDMWAIPSDIVAAKADGQVLASVVAQVEDPTRFLARIAWLKQHPDEKGQDRIAGRGGRTFDCHWAPLVAPDGTILGRVWFFREVTRALALEAQLLQAQRLESVGRLAGGIAHDFNNLLSVILSYTEFALRRAAEGDPIRSDLAEVKKAGQRAATLTRQLLAFSRQQVLDPVSLDLNQVVLGFERMLRRVLGEDIEMVETLAPDLGPVRADPGQIEQVLMNLAVNARDAMPEGGRLTIATANARIDEGAAGLPDGLAAGAYVKLTVGDSGIGMDRQTLERIFEPFFTTKEIGKGTGLGLSTVYGIVKQSAGGIRVRSQVGQGTTFDVFLPQDAFDVPPQAAPPYGSPPRASGAETVLLVEDEAALREAVRRSLQGDGYTVLTAPDGEEALRIAGDHAGAIHLLLTDVIMPSMGGRALAEELRKSRPAVKVLYMSGYAHEASVGLDLGDAGGELIGKPFSAADLARKVRAVLDGPSMAHPRKSENPEAPGGTDGTLPEGVPGEVLIRLRQAVEAARYDDVVALIATLRASHPELATRLAALAEAFDYQGLRGLLHR